MRLLKLLAALLLLVPLACAVEATAQVVYRITGVATSTRDGAPVPYCRMQVVESVSTVALPEPRRGGPNGFSARAGQRGQAREPAEVDADVHGRFQITVDHAGAYVLTGSAREYRRQNFDAHESFFSSIVLTPAVPAVDVVFRMQRDASIAGLVLDEAGEPVRTAQVYAETPGAQQQQGTRFARGGGGQQAGFAQTDDRGRYELSGLAPGAYRVRVQAQPWYAQSANRRVGGPTTGSSLDPSLDVVYAPTWFPGVEDEAAAELIRVTGGEEREADFHMMPIAAVHLIVPRPEMPVAAEGQLRPQPRALVTRVSPGGGGFVQTVATNGTTQEFGGLSPGVYEIATVGADGHPEPGARQFRVLPGASGVVDLSTATPLTTVKLIVEGADWSEAGQITFVDVATGRTVRTDDNFGTFGGRRRGNGDDPEREHLVYLSQGKWEVYAGLSATTYLVTLEVKGAMATGSMLEVGMEAVTLTLHMGSGRGEVSGIASVAGKAVAGAMVLLVPVTLGEAGSLAEVQRDQTNTDGSFSLHGVVPGKYILLAIDHGWEVKWRDPATLAGYLARGVPVDVGSKVKLKRDLDALEP